MIKDLFDELPKTSENASQVHEIRILAITEQLVNKILPVESKGYQA